MLTGTKQRLASFWHYLRLPLRAKKERRKDRHGLPGSDPGAKRAVKAAVDWLGRAQDCSLSQDGGVARHYSLIDGWSTSYPETTGYIVPTMVHYSRLSGDEACRERARRMLNWLVSIQMPEGAFQGGMVGETPLVPTVFDTGQILLGLVAGVEEFGDDRYHVAMCRAAEWLVKTQNPNGCWEQQVSPFGLSGPKAYDTHVAWGLFEAARVEPGRDYAASALANVNWALAQQQDNGWFRRCCLTNHSQPLTHTLGYALRGMLEAYRHTGDASLLKGAQRTADGLLEAAGHDGFMPGRLNADWSGAVEWACLTGTVQIAACWLILYGEVGDPRYRAAAFAANRYVRRTVRLDGPPETRGGVKGSFPVDGGYGTYQYLNWACKFLIDANVAEKRLTTTGSAGRD